MKALTVKPGTPNSAALEDVPEPPLSDGSVLVNTLQIGICGTDLEINAGEYGWAPHGSDRLILGHESLGRIQEAPSGSGVQEGDLVVGIVRRPDPVPCPACAVLEWDMCRNGKYTERGIKERNGYASERYRIEPDFLVRLDPGLTDVGVLIEPASVVAKAWDQVERIGRRAKWEPKTALVTGAGPIGLLAALLSVERGLETHVLDRVESGLKPQLVRDLGGTYHTGSLDRLGFEPDVIIECTGASQVIVDAMCHLAPEGILCLAGVSSGGHKISLDMGSINRQLVLENGVIFGSVNANRSHYQMAADSLAKANRDWLKRLINRRESVSDWASALKRQPNDIKVAIHFN
jgi:threonine dehydrogenase-like Zn-dependent dehydrogenase